jgi:hypothetical protein
MTVKLQQLRSLSPRFHYPLSSLTPGCVHCGEESTSHHGAIMSLWTIILPYGHVATHGTPSHDQAAAIVIAGAQCDSVLLDYHLTAVTDFLVSLLRKEMTSAVLHLLPLQRNLVTSCVLCGSTCNLHYIIRAIPPDEQVLGQAYTAA